MKFRKTHNNKYWLDFGSPSKLDKKLYGVYKEATKYSIEFGLFCTKFRIHGVASSNNPHWSTKKYYVINHQWLGRNTQKVYNWLFSTFAPKKWRIEKHIDTWIEESGMCNVCHEYTSVMSPCCGGTVEFEGNTEYWEDLLSEVCECENKGTCYACEYYDKVV